MSDAWRLEERSDDMVTVVIPNYNGAHLLPDCLQSLQRQDGLAAEVVVVDNGSIDESEAVTRSFAARWMPLGQNRGLAAACNAGARAVETELLFFANSDMRFAPDCLVRLVETLHDRGDTAFSADPLQFDWEGERIIHYRTVLRSARSVREALAEGVFQSPPLVRTYAPADAAVEIPWGCGGSLMVRRERFMALGGFDDTFFLDFEDVDLCWRAGMRGWTHWFVPDSRLWHHWGASNDAPLRAARPDLARRLRRTRAKRLISQAHNHVRFALKTLEPEHAARVVLAKLAAAGVYAIRGQIATGSSLAHGVMRAVCSWPAIRRERALIRHSSRVTSRELLYRFGTWDGPDALIWESTNCELGLPATRVAEQCALEMKP